jgi:SWI/SNF-related matrix-associated actin-dependent regulator 1 of chromatin subfamily A
MTQLKPFQLEDCKRIHAWNGRALLAWEMGLGKTIASLYWVLKTPKRRPVVIVCPAGLRWTWQAEAALHFNMRAEVIEGRMKKRSNAPQGEIYIIGYDILDSWLPFLCKLKPQTVIADEAQYLKNHLAQRSKAAHRLVKGASSVLALSGTPLVNRPIELWSILRLVKPQLFPSRQEYAWRYCAPRWTPWGWKYTGANHLDELHDKLHRNVMIRRRKKDVLKDLPPKERRMISMRFESYSEYNHAQNDFLNWLGTISPSAANRAKKSQALVKVGYLLRLVAREKIKLTIQWIEEFFESNPKEKLMALTMHTAVIDMLKKRFPHAVVIDGRVQGHKRVDAVRMFTHNSKTNLLLGNWKAAGVGLNLQAARYGVGLDFPWTPGDLLQGEDRLHRIGQKFNVTLFYLAVQDTVEEKLVKLLLSKSKVLDSVLNGKAEVKDVDIFEELLTQFQNI